MAFNRADYVKVKEEYEKKRILAEKSAEDRKKQYCKAHPEMDEICRKLDETGPKVYAAALLGKDGYEERLAAIRAETEELLQKQKKMLADDGYGEDLFDVRYECPLCYDRGNINGKMCSCMRDRLVKAGYESSGIGTLVDKMNFDTFDLSFYTGDDRRNMKTVYEKAREYAENFHGKGSGSLLFFGGTGLGKTHLSVAVAKKVIESGYYTVYCTSDELFTDLREDRFRDKDDRSDPVTDKYAECELLVIDDLGTELNGRDIIPHLYNMLNQRINKGLSTVISTNLSHTELLGKYDDRIVSRLFGEFLPYRFTGKDVRMQKLQVRR